MKKILIWGTGNIAEQFIQNECGGEIVGFIETHKSRETYMQKPVYDSIYKAQVSGNEKQQRSCL